VTKTYPSKLPQLNITSSPEKKIRWKRVGSPHPKNSPMRPGRLAGKEAQISLNPSAAPNEVSKVITSPVMVSMRTALRAKRRKFGRNGRSGISNKPCLARLANQFFQVVETSRFLFFKSQRNGKLYSGWLRRSQSSIMDFGHKERSLTRTVLSKEDRTT
jgi:hypothetical protein